MKDQQEAEKKKVTSMDIQATIEVYIELLSPLNPYINMRILPTVHCAGTDKENSSNDHELLEFAIISFILMTLMCDSGMILYGEIRCLPL